MEARGFTIERLQPPVAETDVRGLSELLVDAVDSGAAVSFLAPLSVEEASRWWKEVLARKTERSVLLVARDGEDIVGAVQLDPAWAPNQPHRAEVSKLLVHRRSRGAGLGAQLMQEVERLAFEAGFSLLTLDAKRGTAAERLYRRLGWVEAGIIPRYALDSDGTPHDTVIFYKALEEPKFRDPSSAQTPGE